MEFNKNDCFPGHIGRKEITQSVLPTSTMSESADLLHKYFQRRSSANNRPNRNICRTANPFRLVLLGLAIYRVYKVYKRCVSQIKGRIFRKLPADTLQSKSLFFYCWWMSFPLDDSNKRTHYLRKLLHSFFIRTFFTIHACVLKEPATFG